jgi:L-seryl-tRNA(Ser) seleniumtransferase
MADQGSNAKQQLLRALPQVGELVDHPSAKGLVELFGHARVRDAARLAIDGVRGAVLAGELTGPETPAPAHYIAAMERWLDDTDRASLCRVINGTGVILHTSLGRAVLSEDAWRSAAEVARGASMLELDRVSGKRADRDQHIAALACELTGAEAATVVNNNAAATWLILNELAGEGREVVIARAHMVEIGGSYRMPDVMRLSGAKMVEVGATNKCRASDYEKAVTKNTACILKVHTSNYRIEGFTEYATLEDLVPIGRKTGVPVVYDLGAGSLVDLKPFGLAEEPTVPELIAQGADLVCFSGDKLLGGPQAGICVGRADLIARLKKNQMFRMLRCDKVTLALLEATFRLYRNPSSVLSKIPALSAISEPLGVVQHRAEQLMLALGDVDGCRAELLNHEAYVGGGSLPTERLPSYAIKLHVPGWSPDQLATALRTGRPSVFGRIKDDSFLLDCRTVRDTDIADVAAAVSNVVAAI